MPRVKPPNGIDPRWKAVGARIAADRKKLGIGQAELGRRIGLGTPTTMWRYESGSISIPIARLEQIAEVLGKPAGRYIPATNKPQQRAKLTEAEEIDLHLQLAAVALEAAHKRTPEARDALNELIAEIHSRTGR